VRGLWLAAITFLSATEVTQWSIRAAQFREVVAPTQEELHRYGQRQALTSLRAKPAEERKLGGRTCESQQRRGGY